MHGYPTAQRFGREILDFHCAVAIDELVQVELRLVERATRDPSADLADIGGDFSDSVAVAKMAGALDRPAGHQLVELLLDERFDLGVLLAQDEGDLLSVDLDEPATAFAIPGFAGETDSSIQNTRGSTLPRSSGSKGLLNTSGAG
ncbi:MAG: hypothetical protein K1X74_07470 [Pirellulales bacterium]|nr:hypothetical protein [Pirellulales bacterium]